MNTRHNFMYKTTIDTFLYCLLCERFALFLIKNNITVEE